MKLIAVAFSVVTFVCPPVVRGPAPPSDTLPHAFDIPIPDPTTTISYRLPVIPSAPCQ